MPKSKLNFALGALVVACFSLTLIAAGAAKSEEVPTRTMVLNGSGTASVKPDVALFTISVIERADAAAAAMGQNAQKMTEAFAVLNEAGVLEKNIQTSGLNLSPLYAPYNSRKAGEAQKIVGYQTQNGLSVRLTDISKTGAVLDALVEAGINSFGAVRFTVEDQTPLLDAARKAAVADALRKAELIATAANVELGQIISLSEAGHPNPPQPMMMEAAMRSADMAKTPVSAGMVQLRASVSITWQLK